MRDAWQRRDEAPFDWRRPGYDRAAAMTAVNQARRTRVGTPIALPKRSRFAPKGTADPAHGTYTAYQRGCGCVACRAANTEAARRRRGGG